VGRPAPEISEAGAGLAREAKVTGFFGTNTSGILGYAPVSAQALGFNILLYALHPKVSDAKALNQCHWPLSATFPGFIRLGR
jgi:hypothetical protein